MIKRERFTLSVPWARGATPAEVEASRGPDGKAKLSEFSKVDIGVIEGVIEVEVDMGGIARMLGERALRSRGKKAIEAGGLVTVRARSIVRRETKNTA